MLRYIKINLMCQSNLGQVKHMNIVSLAEGNSLWIQTLKSERQATADRLFRLVMSKFEASIRSTPDNGDTLNNYAEVLIKYALSTEGNLYCLRLHE